VVSVALFRVDPERGRHLLGVLTGEDAQQGVALRLVGALVNEGLHDVPSCLPQVLHGRGMIGFM
jgi:hypothetical protein